jgi:hypothetical protein
MDPKWWYRLGLAAVVVAFIVIIVRMSMLAFSPEATHLDRAEAQAVGKPAPAKPRQ